MFFVTSVFQLLLTKVIQRTILVDFLSCFNHAAPLNIMAGHDVFFYHSNAGGMFILDGGNNNILVIRLFVAGCCDCGDAEAWSPNGFCHRHGKQSAEPIANIPIEIRETSQPVLELLAIRLARFCEAYSDIFPPELDTIDVPGFPTYLVLHLDDLHRCVT